MSQDLKEQVSLLAHQLRQLQADNERQCQGNIVATEQGETASQGEPTGHG